MKRWWSGFRWMLATSSDSGWYLTLVVLLPIVLLVLAGLYWLTTQHMLLIFMLVWGIVTLLFGVVFYWRNRNQVDVPPAASNLPPLTAGAEWTDRDHAAWQLAQSFIGANVVANLRWENLRDLAIEQHGLLAQHYFSQQKNQQLGFTLPELLLVLEQTSARYRRFVLEHIPFADSVQLASLKSLYDHKDRMSSGYRVFNLTRRLWRLSNPLAAAAGELRDHISGKVLHRANQKLQLELKRTLLEESAQVAIDLFSGRLKVDDAQLTDFISAAARKDPERIAAAVEPLRLVVVGQVSAGKSSLINALTSTASSAALAETDVLPTTECLTAHRLQLDQQQECLLLDTPGLDTTDDATARMCELAATADMLLWVIKANQPARAADAAALRSITLWFAAQAERIPPPVVLALTHCDQLHPVGEWSPPYSWPKGNESHDDSSPHSKKGHTIAAAAASILTVLALDPDTPVIALALSAEVENSNVDALLASLGTLTNRATQVQLNRRRHELARQSTALGERLSQTGKLLKNTLSRLKQRR